MPSLEMFQSNVLSPMVLAFALGVVANLLRSDLKFPDALYSSLTIYLLFAIGLKGGAALSQSTPADLWAPALSTIALGALIPAWCYPVLRKLGRFSRPDAAAIAIHYGSVSAVTFIACTSYLDGMGVSYEGFAPALLAIMEAPAIIVGLAIAATRQGAVESRGEVMREVVTGKSIVLLIGGLLIGLAVGAEGFEESKAFFVTPFKGVLALFMLEMGLVAGRRLADLKKAGAFLLLFGVLMPLFNGFVGAFAGVLSGLSVGGATLLGTLAASASYIAAPAAVRMAIPQANPSLYLTSSLAITFPFNLTVGIVVYFAYAEWLTGVLG